jgi:hypothetical protein
LEKKKEPMFSLGRPPLPEKGKGGKFNQLKKRDEV